MRREVAGETQCLTYVEGADGEYQRVLWVGLPGVYLLKGQKNIAVLAGCAGKWLEKHSV